VKVIKTFIAFLLWDIAFYVMVSIMIIAVGYARDRMNQVADMQYTYMYLGMHALLWLLVGGFLVFLFNLKKSVGSKGAKIVEFIVISVPALFFVTMYFNYLHIPIPQFLANNVELMRSIGALVFGCEVFGLIMKKRR
jgi:hypothetical protein